jgi:N-ethylmaleimide reductase
MQANQAGTEHPNLFTPISIGKLELPNRIIMAPLTRNRAGEGNVPHDLNVTYYQQRATAGLIISEATQVSPEGIGYPATPGIHSQEQIDGWKKITEAVHNKGGHIFLQLWYCGRISHPSMLPDEQTPVSASAIKPEGEAVTYTGMQPFVEPRALTLEEMPGIIDQYRQAAKNAQAAGFDGIEVHAANGYLIDQFLRDGTNQRDDAYGGSLENRLRLLQEVLAAVTEVWEPGQVGVRISPENSFNDIRDSQAQVTFDYVAKALSGKGLGYLHVVEGDMLTGERNLNYRQIRDHFDGPYMANCGYTLAKAQQSLAQGDADLVSFGTLYIANPDLVERFTANVELNTPDQNTYYGGDEHGYTDYPSL